MYTPPRNPKHNPNRKVGKGMLALFWVLLLLLLYAIFDSRLNKAMYPNQKLAGFVNESGQPEVHLLRNHANQYLTIGKINDRHVMFFVDTGATSVAIPAKIAEKLGLEKMGEGIAATAGGRVKIYFTKLDSLQIGNITLYDVSATISPGLEGNTVLLGMSALKKLEFMQIDDTLILKQVVAE